jgi:hypothetical protein
MRLTRGALAATTGAVLLLLGGIAPATAAERPTSTASVVITAAEADTDVDDTASSTEAAPLLAKAESAAITPPAGQCVGWITEYAATCFQWVGDNQWIEDRDANGWAAVVHVQTNYGKNRYCQALPAAEGWGYCDYDHKEGKCVRFELYEAKGSEKRNWSGWSPWFGTAYGSPC